MWKRGDAKSRAYAIAMTAELLRYFQNRRTRNGVVLQSPMPVLQK